MTMDDNAQQYLNQLAKKMGNENASTFLNVLGRQKQFLNAIETPLGQELLKDAVKNAEDVISLIMMEKDKPEDRAILKAYLSIINKWQKIIVDYEKNRNKLVKITNRRAKNG